MRALVTGADGLLGSNLTRELLQHGMTVRAFVHHASTSKSLDGLPIEQHRGDIRCSKEVLRACQDVDFVFHCAAITNLMANPTVVWDVNLNGTRNVIEACLAQKVKRLLFVGTASSFAFGTSEKPGDESGSFPPEYRGFDYMESKAEAMRLVQKAVRERNLDAVILAPTFMLGAHDTGPSSGELIAQFIKRGLRFVSSGGRNFVHVQDVARALVAAMDAGTKGEAYLLAGENLSYHEFFSIVAEVANTPSPLGALPSIAIRGAGRLGSSFERVTGRVAPVNDSIAKAACLSVFYNPAKAIAELGMPQTPIREAVEASIQSLRAHGHWPSTSTGKTTGKANASSDIFAGKTALISGGSRGLGYAVAAELARRGANVMITARGAERLESSREKLARTGAQVAAVAGDVGKWDDAKRMVDATVEQFGSLDILVNNAGISMRGQFDSLSPDVCANVIGTNLLGSIHLSRAAVDAISKARGHIVFISSIAGIFGLPGASVYCASKGAMRGLSESLRLELIPRGVHVGVVNLGFTEHDPDKRILGSDGSSLLPDRPAHHTQEEAALLVVDMIEKRKRKVTLTPIGKLGSLAYRLSPHIVERSILSAQSSGWRIFKQFS